MSGQGEALTAEQARVDVRAALMKVHHLSKPSQANPWIDAIEAAAAREALPDEMVRWALYVAREHPDGSNDWACAECKPGSDLTRDGFRCVPHAAHALLRAARASDGGR